MNRMTIALATTVAALLSAPAAAVACSKDDVAYFDAFPDASCLLTLSGTEIDTFGGLRLVTDGAVTDAVWDTDATLSSGVEYEGRTFARRPGSSLVVTGTGTAAKLELPPAAHELSPLPAPVLRPTAPTWRDNDGVSDPAVVKTAGGYVMYYAGVAEDGSGPAIFRLTSADGAAWTRPVTAAQHVPVLEGTPGGFDENGVFGPDVVHDAADASAPYKMWFSGRGDTFDQIGYATSTDGITWTKRATPVVTVGLPGSQDSFSVAHPTVLFDSGLWKMWYEGDDSSKKSIAYATSTDGIAWSKAGSVIQSGSGNVEFGVFAPTVYRDGGTFRMLVGGRKETSGELQTKLINYSSTDGLTWTAGSIALNTGNGFAASNLSSPEVLPEGPSAIKLYYSGNRANQGDARDRIGHAAATGGTASSTAALSLAPRATTIFDARAVSGLAALRPGPESPMVGIYHGFNEDGIPRLGAAHRSEGTWVKDAGPKPLGAILAAGANNQFDEDGQLEPSLLHRPVAGNADDYVLYFTADNDGARTIGLSTTDETAGTLVPSHASWTNPVQALAAGSAGAFDDLDVSHPSVVEALGAFVMYYTAGGSAAGTGIGTVRSATPTGPFATQRAAVTFTGPAACDPDGRRDPVALATSAGVELFYVGLERVDVDGDGATDETIQRTCHATSADGVAFARTGTILNPSQIPYAADESGVAPASIAHGGVGWELMTTVTGRDGRTRGGSAPARIPPGTGVVPSGWATYQLGDDATPERDFRFVEAVTTGQAELWMSVLQPYSTATNRYWSRFFPVDAANEKLDLNFLLNLSGVRWQVRLRRTEVAPSLDRLTIGHAEVHFPASGSATTSDITPPEDFALQGWSALTLRSELFAPLNTGTGGGTVTVLDPDGNTLVAAAPLTVPGNTTVPLSGIDAKAEPALRVRVDLTSATGQASPIVRELKVGYAALQPEATPTPTPTPTPVATATPAPPPPPPPAVLTLAAAAPKVIFGRATTLSGRLTVGAAGVPNTAITVLQQPAGTTAPKPLTTVTTDATGAFTAIVKPAVHTTYSLALANVAAPSAVAVQVAHALSLKVALKGRVATFTGKLGPRHARRTITIQRKSGTKWVRLARVRTTRRSTFTFARRLARGRHRFRAVTGKDATHLGGRSPVRRVRIR